MENSDRKRKLPLHSNEYTMEKRMPIQFHNNSREEERLHDYTLASLTQELNSDSPKEEAGCSYRNPVTQNLVSSVCDNHKMDQRKVKTINDLPNEMLVEIFKYLDVEDLVFGVKHVSQLWAEVSQDSRVWKCMSYAPAGHTPLRSVISVLNQSPKLKVFHACSQPGTDLDVLDAVGENCRVLKKLSLCVDTWNCRSVGALLINKLSHTLEELHVKLDGIAEVDSLNIFDFDEKDLFNAIGLCVNLRSLVLSGVIVDYVYNTMGGLAIGCPKLQELNTVHLCGLDKKDFNLFLREKGYKFRSLTVDWNFLQTDDTLPIIVECCKKLEKLSVGNYCLKPMKLPEMFKDTRIVPADFVALKQIVGLKELVMPHLGHSYASSFVDLFVNGNLYSLTALDLSFVACVNDLIVHSISENCTSLERLNIKSCPNVNDESFKCINRLSKLKHLNVEKCIQIRDKGVEYIVRCKTLRYLNLKCCPRVSINGLKLCCQNLKLYEIHFNSCRIYKEDVIGLHSCPLKFLEIRESDE